MGLISPLQKKKKKSGFPPFIFIAQSDTKMAANLSLSAPPPSLLPLLRDCVTTLGLSSTKRSSSDTWPWDSSGRPKAVRSYQLYVWFTCLDLTPFPSTAGQREQRAQFLWSVLSFGTRATERWFWFLKAINIYIHIYISLKGYKLYGCRVELCILFWGNNWLGIWMWRVTSAWLSTDHVLSCRPQMPQTVCVFLHHLGKPTVQAVCRHRDSFRAFPDSHWLHCSCDPGSVHLGSRTEAGALCIFSRTDSRLVVELITLQTSSNCIWARSLLVVWLRDAAPSATRRCWQPPAPQVCCSKAAQPRYQRHFQISL